MPCPSVIRLVHCDLIVGVSTFPGLCHLPALVRISNTSRVTINPKHLSGKSNTGLFLARITVQYGSADPAPSGDSGAQVPSVL